MQRIVKQAMRPQLLNAILATLVVMQSAPPAQSASFSGGGPPRMPPPVHINPLPPAPAPIPTPQPPTQESPPPMPTETSITPLNPRDQVPISLDNPSDGNNADALRGIESLGENGFPQDASKDEDSNYLLIRGEAGAVFHKDSPYSVTVEHGTLLASMRRPTRLAFINVAFGQIALTGDADVLVTCTDSTIHLINLSGRGESVRVKLNRGPFAEGDGSIAALAAGYELVAGNRALKRSDIRVADGFARRHFKVLEGGRLAVCEISTESVLTGSALVAEAAQDKSDKQRRVLADMSKMAAVLNYVNGEEGFVRENSNKLANR